MSQAVILSKRDRGLLAFLEMTPATATQIRKASVTFGEDPFLDERRARERLQSLSDARLVRSWPAAVAGGGLRHYYRLSPEGYRMVHPDSADLPPRVTVSEIAPSRFLHAMATADVITQTLVACHAANIRVQRLLGDGRLTLEIGEYRQQPDCHFQLEYGGRWLNILFEIDNATEPLDSRREHSIRTKILGYETYQDWVLRNWKESGATGVRPGFRVVFLTLGAERANHILWLARQLATNPDRRLVYASTQDVYQGESQAVTQPILNDHHGDWQALVNSQPSAQFLRERIRLTPPISPPKGI